MRLFTRAALLAVLALGLAAPVAMTQPAPITVAATTAVTVMIKNFDFSPMTLKIPAGASVTWKNLDGEPHTVTSLDGAFRSTALDEGDSFTFRFTKPGTYRYLCSIHPHMMATIVVTA
jgi:plastocyanin